MHDGLTNPDEAITDDIAETLVSDSSRFMQVATATLLDACIMSTCGS